MFKLRIYTRCLALLVIVAHVSAHVLSVTAQQTPMPFLVVPALGSIYLGDIASETLEQVEYTPSNANFPSLLNILLSRQQIQASAALSPDGMTLAAVLYNPQDETESVTETTGLLEMWTQPSTLYLINSQSRRAEPIAVNAQYPQWSADGSRLAYVADGVFTLYTLSEGSCLSYSLPENAVYPIWSPDEQFVAYYLLDTSSDTVIGADRVGVMHLTTGEVRVLSAGDDIAPRLNTLAPMVWLGSTPPPGS